MIRLAQSLVLVGMFALAGLALAPQLPPRPAAPESVAAAAPNKGKPTADDPAIKTPAPASGGTMTAALPPRPGLSADAVSIKLSPQNLPQMVQTAGFQVRQMATDKGQPFWKASAQLDGWKYEIEVRPTFDSQSQIINFWLVSELSSPVPASNLPASAMLKLLDANRTLAPYFFAHNPGNGRLTLNWQHPFHDSNPNEIKQSLHKFCQKIRDTESLWGNSPNPAAPATAANLAGTTWTGKQDITGPWTPVTFQFHAGGQAVAIVAGKNFHGTWTQTGDQVTMNFLGAANHNGTITGTTLSGKGQDSVAPWNFTVTKSN